MSGLKLGNCNMFVLFVWGVGTVEVESKLYSLHISHPSKLLLLGSFFGMG
jgi:hypothetical protein